MTHNVTGRHGSAVHFGSALLPDGWAADVRVVIANGRIAQVSRGAPAQEGDERAGIGVAGMPNLHSHAFQRGMAGLAEHRGSRADSFWSWREVMYRFVERLTPDDLEVIAAQAYVEMLECGFTRVGEFHYLHHDVDGRPFANPAEMGARIAAACEITGIGLTLLPVFYAHGGFGGQPVSAAQKRFLTDRGAYARLIEASRKVASALDNAVVGIAPHSLRAVTPDELADVLPVAGSGPIHIHIAEQMREVEECRAWSGARPVEWLLSAAPVDRRWCLVHATHVNEDEVLRLAGSGAVAGLCPVTEANLGDGIFPAARFVAAGGHLGVGSDSNVRIDLPEELRWLEYTQRLEQQARNVVAAPPMSTGRTLFERALDGGARALGVAAGIVAGAPADFVSLASDHVAFVGRRDDALLDSLIFAARGDAISDVWCGGRKVVSDGVHHRRAEVAARFRETLARLTAC